jgi:hypothetical protein
MTGAKNAYKREGKPVDRIISIDRLAQAVLAVLLQEPHTARARPTTAIKNEEDYKRIFSGDKVKQPLEMYGVIVRMLNAVEEYFRTLSNQEDRIYRNNMKFHALMALGCERRGVRRRKHEVRCALCRASIFTSRSCDPGCGIAPLRRCAARRSALFRPGRRSSG